MFEYIKNQKYFAQVTGSIEKYAAQELTELGAEVLNEVSRGLRFSCSKEVLYKILYSSRLCQRILAPLISMQCHSEKYLYNQALNNIDWTSLININQCFSIITNVNNSHISNSLYAGQILKDAICDQFKAKYNARPNFKPKDGDIVLSLYINENWATISYDISGKSLHKRGYRQFSTVAPIQETIGAAIIKLTNWNHELQFHDIMCGSGTLLAEALMSYSKIPAGYLREDTAIKYMPDFDSKLWDRVKESENQKIIPLPKNLITGSDIDKESVEIAKTNLKSLPYGENIKVFNTDFQSLPLQEKRIIVCNPPYGVRMGKTETIKKLYNDLGDFLKQKCPKSEAYILCGKSDLVPELRLRAHWKKTLKNADIETKLVKIIIK